jgi:hypothetical protein
VLRPSRPLLAGVAGFLALAGSALGCGGGSDDGDQSAKTAPGAETPPPALRTADRKAFAEIQRSSGVLRAAAIPVAYGAAPRIVVADRLNVASRALARDVPRNALLRRLRRTALRGLRATASPAAQREATAKAIAESAIAEADRIDAGLRRYAASHPAANELPPS